MVTIRECTDKEVWDEYVIDNGGHPLQLWGWGEVKSRHNWRVARVFVEREGQVIGAAQLLIRTLPLLFRALVYIPRGPVVASEDRGVVLEALSAHAKSVYKPVSLTIEPDWKEMPELSGWQRSLNTILIPRTLILDLAKTEDELLADMAKKTRQYIRKSASDGVSVRRAKSREDIAQCLEIYRQTAERAGFALHGDEYYYDIFDKLDDFSPVFVAEHDEKVVAFLWPLISQDVTFELYGGMNDEGQSLRANYTLKWSVIQQMKSWGITRYDMNGLLNDGVSTFKQSFASHEDMLAGTYDKPLSPLYSAWTRGLPFAKKILRTLRRR